MWDVSRKGSEVIQFRVSPELRGALQAYATKYELDSDSAAARLILSTVLGMEEGASAKDAARAAAVNEAIWSATRLTREVMDSELMNFAGAIGKKLLQRVRGG